MSPFAKRTAVLSGLAVFVVLIAAASLLRYFSSSAHPEKTASSAVARSGTVLLPSSHAPGPATDDAIQQPQALESADFAIGKGRPGDANRDNRVHYAGKVAVLMYHDFKEDPKEKSISLEVFADQLSTLKANGFHFISMDDFKAFKLNRGKVPANAVLITFDDGYEDFYTVAYPYLLENKIPATGFIIVHSTDTGNPGGNPHLTWDQMREMTKNGMSFYNHTYNQHFYIPGSGPALTSRYPAADGRPAETADQYRKRITDDLAFADKRIHDELGTSTDVFCYPYGANNRDTRAISAALGHKLDVTIQPGLNDPAGRMVFRINAGYKSIGGQDLIAAIKKYVK